MRRLLLASSLAALLAVASPAAASPLDTYGFGSRETAMGSAVTADTKGFSSAFYNPAGAAFAKGLDLSFGYFRVDQRLAINGSDTGVDPVKGVVFGLAAPGTIAGLPFAFALGVHLPDDRLSRVRTLRQDIPRWEIYDNRAQILFIASTVAIRPLPWLSIGGGIGYLSSTRGSLDISGQAKLKDVYDSQLRHQVDADLTTVRIPLFGARVDPLDNLSFGLAYRGEAKLDLHLDATVHGTVDSQIGVIVPVRYTLTSQSYDAFHPRQLALGTSWLPVPRVRANIDLVWLNWAAYQSATSQSTAHLDIQNVSGLVAVPPDPKPTIVRDPAFSNRIVPHLGVEVVTLALAHFELPVRAGYVYERSPVPPQTGPTNFVDADRHTISFGLGARLIAPIAELPGDVRLDGHVAYSMLPQRTTTKESPADFVGNYVAGGHQTNVGATLGVGF
jgi:long-chain fatty acid transport protein